MNGPVHLNDLPDWTEAAFDYPVEHATVIRRAGDRTLEAPAPAESETVATALDRSREDTYRTADQLRAAIRGGVGEAYVGRKRYDDRGGNPLAAMPGTAPGTVESI